MSDEKRTSVHVQWKGTEVCLDFYCACGMRGHFDGDFAYNLECEGCERVWEMPNNFELVEVEDGDPLRAVTQGTRRHDLPAGPDKVTVELDRE